MNKHPIIVPSVAGRNEKLFKWLELPIAGSKRPKNDAEIIIPAENPLTTELNFVEISFFNRNIKLEPKMVAINGINEPRVISKILFISFPLR